MNRTRVVIFGSSRRDGNTKKAVELVLEGFDYKFVDLSDLKISPFDYAHANRDDDFLPLMEKIVEYSDIILATPVYWYAACAQMKIFIDRLSDLLTIRKDLGRKLTAKNLFVICSYAGNLSLVSSSFETPIRLTSNYLQMAYRGCLYYSQDGKIKVQTSDLKEFQKHLLR